MAISKSKVFVSLLLFSLLVLDLVAASTSNPLLDKIDCDGACSVRCGLSSRPHLCKRACGTCCARCNCVPPGTSGHQETCPCWAKQTTHGGRPKCP